MGSPRTNGDFHRFPGVPFPSSVYALVLNPKPHQTLLIIALSTDLSFLDSTKQQELEEHIRLARRAISTVWHAHFPRKWRVLQLVVWVGDSGGSQGSYDPDARRVWLHMPYIALLSDLLDLTMEQAVILIAAHEAVHSVHQAQGAEVFISNDPTGQTKDEYWNHEQEQQARSIAGALLSSVCPAVSLPQEWSGAEVPADLVHSLGEVWGQSPETRDKCIEVLRQNEWLLPRRRRWPRYWLRKALSFRPWLLRIVRRQSQG